MLRLVQPKVKYPHTQDGRIPSTSNDALQRVDPAAHEAANAARSAWISALEALAPMIATASDAARLGCV